MAKSKQKPVATMDRDGLKIRLFVLDRGFVYIARSENPMNAGFWIPVTHQRGVRNWGTTGKGLGFLSQGPTSETILDEMCLEATIPVRAILEVKEVDQAAWEEYLL